MRTALLAALRRTTDGQLRASMTLAGRSVLGWQALVAQALGCERVICLVDEATPDILKVQQEVEKAGGEFHALRGFARLPALLRGEDELVILADGLLLDSEWASANLISPPGSALRKTVLCLAPDHRLAVKFPEEFERVDAEKCWAGLLVMRAAPAQKLADFPGDGDAVSLLLRLALQAHTPCTVLGADDIEKAQWLLADKNETLRAREQALMDASGTNVLWPAPGKWAAEQTARLLSPWAFGSGKRLVAAAAVLTMLAAAILAGVGYATAAIAVLAVGVFALSLATQIDTVERQLLGAASDNWIATVNTRFVDLAMAGVFGLAMSSLASGAISMIALAFLSVGLVHIAARTSHPVIGALWSDRTLHTTLLAIAAGVAMLPEALALLGLLALVTALAESRRASAEN